MIESLPLRITDDGVVVDSKNNTVFILTWKGDLDHTRKQAKIGQYIIGLVHKAAGINPVQGKSKAA